MLFYTLAFLQIYNEEKPCNVSYAEFHDVKLDFRFGLQPFLSLRG
jgi:hypothetical protein